MTTKEVAEKYGVASITVRTWCKKSSVKRVLGKQGVMEYNLTEKDLVKFENRNSRGWKKGRSRKTVNE